MSEKKTVADAVKALKKLGIAASGMTVPKAKLPKTKLGGLADTLYTVREQRLALGRLADAMKAEEQRITDHLIDTLDADTEGGAVGKHYKAIVKRDDRPVIEDYDALTAHIRETGEFDLLNRALNTAAAKARFENEVAIPGVGTFQAKKISLTKV